MAVLSFTAAIRRDGEWWIGSGVNSQGATLGEFPLEKLQDGLCEALEMNRGDNRFD
jgi:hypothetical protein